MRKSHRHLLFIGTNGHVRAVHKGTGKDVWTTSLPGTGYSIVSLMYEAGFLFAGSKGYVFALDATNGRILWTNRLEGLNYEHMVLASVGGSSDPLPVWTVIEEDDKKRREQAQDFAEELVNSE